MGGVCQALNGAFGGGSGGSGGSGATDVYEDLFNSNQELGSDNSDIYDEDNISALRERIEGTVSGENRCIESTWIYPQTSISRIDVLIPNGEVDTGEFVLFDTDGSCEITEEEIRVYEETIGAFNSDGPSQ